MYSEKNWLERGLTLQARAQPAAGPGADAHGSTSPRAGLRSYRRPSADAQYMLNRQICRQNCPDTRTRVSPAPVFAALLGQLIDVGKPITVALTHQD